MCPGQIAPHLAHFVGPWCSALRSIRDDVEKEHAFSGLCALLRANPEVLPCRLPPCTAKCILCSELGPAWKVTVLPGSGRHRCPSIKVCTNESTLGGLPLFLPGWLSPALLEWHFRLQLRQHIILMLLVSSSDAGRRQP